MTQRNLNEERRQNQDLEQDQNRGLGSNREGLERQVSTQGEEANSEELESGSRLREDQSQLGREGRQEEDLQRTSTQQGREQQQQSQNPQRGNTPRQNETEE